jgi:hypothetical protein
MNTIVFQSHYRAVTGRALEVNFRRRATVLTVVLVMVTCGRETLYQALEDNLQNYLVLLTYFYQALLRDTMGLTWYLLCSLLQKTSQNLVVSFQKAGVTNVLRYSHQYSNSIHVRETIVCHPEVISFCMTIIIINNNNNNNNNSL